MISIAFVVAVLAQDPPSAEKLAAKMQDALNKARTVQFSFSLAMEGDADREFVGKIEGTLWLAQGNKMRLEMKLPERSVVLVSDGTNVGGTKDGKPHDKSAPTPASLNTNLIHAMCHGGLAIGAMPWLNHVDKLEGDKDAGVAATGLKLGAKEGDVQALEFEISREGKDEKVKATMWIDEKTGLPVKFLVPDSGKGDFGRNMKITETYTGFKLDAEIAKEKFEIPK